METIQLQDHCLQFQDQQIAEQCHHLQFWDQQIDQQVEEQHRHLQLQDQQIAELKAENLFLRAAYGECKQWLDFSTPQKCRVIRQVTSPLLPYQSMLMVSTLMEASIKSIVMASVIESMDMASIIKSMDKIKY
jgi:hypothetical protein